MTSARVLAADIGLLLIRLMLAAIGIAHGGQKLFGMFGGKGPAPFAEFLAGLNVPMPTAAAYTCGTTEFFGGLLIGIGLLTRPAAAVFAINMIVAILLVHRGGFFSGPPANGMEYPLTIAVAALALALTGPGGLSIDALRHPRTKLS